MKMEKIVRSFEQIGASVEVTDTHRPKSRHWIGPSRFSLTALRPWRPQQSPFQLDTLDADVKVLDCRPDSQALLLGVRVEGPGGAGTVSRHLCGRHEDFWFAWPVPEDRHVSSVPAALAALAAGRRELERALLGPFATMGARARLRWGPGDGYSLDLKKDGKGQVFEIELGMAQDCIPRVLDCRPRDRHLVLMIRRRPVSRARQDHRYLCGHDEREWFAAALPEKKPVTTVDQAREALKPRQVKRAQIVRRLAREDRNRRRNDAFVRQGEWFFLPAPDLEVDPRLVLRNEPLVRGRSKPHVAELCYRQGGQIVYVSRWARLGMTEEARAELIRKDPRAAAGPWTVMRRDPVVHVRGRIRHPDHKTVVLDGWHRVVPNTEDQSRARSNLAFLD